jgi:hypothetical protein
MTAPDPGRVLRWGLVAWGLGHLLIGRHALGCGLLAAEGVSVLLVAWLAIGLADTSAYLVPFVAGTAFMVAWGWQAIDAYRSAGRLAAARPPTPERSPAAAIGWLSLPLLVWGTGFWLVGAHAATPASVLDRFVTAWSDDAFDETWPPSIVAEADAAAADLGPGLDRFRDIRFSIVSRGAARATAVAETIHYERRDSRFLWVFPGAQLVPVADERLLTLDLAARSAELPGGGDIGAVRWELVAVHAE